MRKLKLFTFLLALVASVGMSWATSQPVGYVDVCTAHPGSIHLVGWANDPDALSTSLPIHVYVDQPNGGSSYINEHGYNLGTTNVWREDGVNPQYTGYHKIDRYINIMEASGAGTYRIRAYALDAVGNNGNPLMPHSYLNGMPTTATLTVPAPYSITYNANGGNGAPAADYKCYGINKTLSSTVPTRDGYTFIGWNTEQNGSGTSYAKGATYSANASATLYAKWTANKYTVTFNQQSGSGGSSSVQATYASAMPSATMPTRTGYTFQGYYDATSGGTKYYNANGSSAKNWDKTANTTLYARWTVNQYTITFDGNGGSSVASITQNYGTTIAAPANPTRKGYTFAGWEPALPATMPAQNMTVVAQWTAIPQPSGDILAGFTATAGCGGFGGEDHSKLVDGLFASGNEGVNWTKWCADGQHKSVPSGESESCWWVDFNSANPIAVTGYILTTGNDNTQWGQGRNPNSWKIKAKLNAGDAWTTIATVTNDNTMQVADFTDFSFTLDQAGTYKYFRFMVYEPEYDNCMQLCEFRFLCDAPMTYATGSWTHVSYNTGRTNTPNATSGAISYKGFNGKTGGWGNISYIEDPNRGIGYQVAGTGKNSERKGLYSIYKNEQTIPSYSKQRLTGTFTLNSSDAKYKSTAALYAHNNQSELETYSVDFTHGLKDGTGSSKRITYVVNETKNGSWQSNSANYTYDFDNSTGSAEATKGWYILLAHTIVTDAVYSSGVAEKASFKSTSENYTWYYYKYVTFDPNGGTGDMAVQTVENSAQLHYNAFSRTGYSFAGWNTQPDGNGTSYANEAVITATSTNKGPVTLYAQWTVHQYTISFDSNGGTPVASITQNYGTAVSAPADPTRDGHIFLGWDAEIPATMPAHNVHLVALWNNPAEDRNAILTELYNALGNQVWTGYGAETGVISYSRGDEENEFRASFMGGTYTIDLAFDDFIMAEKFDNGDGSHTYTLEVNLPAQITGMDHEILHVKTNANGEITGVTSVHADAEMTKESDSAIATWAELQAAMTAGGMIKLTHDITAPANAEALTVPAGKTVLVDLNGHIIDRALASAVANGSVIINNGVLAVMDDTGNGKIMGGNTTGKGGGVYNNGTFTLYGGEITGNHADAMGGGVYNHISNSDTEGFWMTGGLIDGNTASEYPAIEGEVAFNNLAVVQVNAGGTTVSVTTAKAHLDVYNYIKPVMPNMNTFAVLAELYAALGDDVWTGYGANTGVISYSRGDEANEFRASFMGGTYTIDIPFGDFTAASKHEEGGKYIYDLTVSLPAQTGMSQETLQVTVNSSGEIEAIHSEAAEIDLKKETNNEITTWADLQNALNEGGKIKLTHDITAPANAEALVIPANKTVMLDLNGHTIDRALASAIANGNVIVNNGVLAIMDETGNGKIKGGKTTGNGGGVLNNGIFTLYAGEITGNSAAQGGGVYNNGGAQGFWMTGGLIDNNTATNGNDAISGNVIFNNLAVVQVDANGTTVSPATAVAGLSHYSYVQPVMPDMDMFAILAELYAALGNDVWTGYGTHTGVISYSRGDEANEFRASFMGGTYTIDIPFGDFTAASRAATAEGGAVYTLVVSLPAQTGMSQETLHVTVNSNGEIEAIHSDIAEIDLKKETNNEITTWAQLQAAMNAGGMIKLTHDITAESTDAALEVPAGKTVVLDLNGFTLDRHLTSAQENGSVIINNGTLAIMGDGEIRGGNNSGNGGGVVNNGAFTQYGGKIVANHAAQGAGVYNSVANNGTVGFWMTGGLIDGNTANSYKAIKGDVTFSNLAVVQINAGGNTVSAATAIAGLATYDYIKPVMPNMDMFAILAELHNALGNDVWAGYGEATGVITYAQGTEQNSFEATFMGGAYSIEIPFGDFTSATKNDNGDGTFTYDLVVNLPAQTGMSQETLHVTTDANGEITGIHSDNAQTDMNKVGGALDSWAALKAAMANGGVLQLSQSLIDTNHEGALVVPAGKTVVLDLNGFTLDRHLTSAQENGSVIINNGTLAIMGDGEIRGGNNSGNGGGVVNNGAFTQYGGKIVANHAAQGAGVYNSVANNGTVGFWMTGGLIAENVAASYPAIKGDVTFSNLAVVQINAGGNTVSAATAIAGLATYDYIKPVMPNMDMFAILAELHNALGNDVWAGYGDATGVITYAQGTEPNSFKATFMGGAYAIEIPFGDFTQAVKVDNGDGTFTYNLDVNLPAQTGLSHEVLHVTTNANGEITGIHSDIAQTDMNKLGGAIASWADLNAAMANGGVLQLSQSLTATNLDGALVVPAGKTVVLDLNGFSLDRHLGSAQADGCVIINNGTLAITDNVGGAEIKGGYNSGNGGGIVNNGTFTLYGGKITGNHAAQGAGVYNSVANDGTVGFWMTGGLIAGNEAASYPAIKGDVTFSNLAVVQINAGGNTVSAATAIAGLATYDYIQPVMPNMDMFAILAELHNALGNDVWAGYGDATGVITYAQGTEPNSFKATFMGGAYAIEIPFGDFTQAEKIDNGNGSYTYNLDVNLPAQTGLSHEVLHVTVANGEITGIHSDIAQTDMNKLGGAIASWADLNAAMANGGVLQLSQSLTAEGTDGALIVPAGKTVVLDLNGFSLDRHLGSAQANGCVIINNGTLAITDNVGGAEIKGGYNSGNGGGIVNNGTFTLYGGKITGNQAAQGAGVYNSVANNGTVGFWMTGGLIAENEAASYPAIKGDVTFSNLAVVQINAGGNTVSAATAIAGLATYDYIKPVMPNMDMFAILAELHNALGNDVWAGYGEATGVITYAQGTEPNSFKATFMGGAYAIEIPFGDFTQAEKIDNGNGTYTYNLDVNLPAQTGLSHEVLHVTTDANGEITGIHSDIAQTDMNKLGGAIASWADLNAAMANGGVLQLSQSLTATNLDGALVVPAGKTVVLDLNGFSLDRHLTSAQANGCVIINNGTLAITDNVGGAEIKGGYNSGNGGGIVNNGTFTLYGGKIVANHAAQGAGVYNSVANTASTGFWMTGGLIAENVAASYPAIKGDVTFSNLAVVQINAGGNTVSAATAIAGMAAYDYIKPVMPNMDMFAILAELHNALGNDVWAGYGDATGVITYAQGTEPNSFKATFMGGAYAIEIPFGDFTQAEKIDNGNGTYTYNLDVNLPAQTGLSHEVLHVTTNANGEITGIHSDIAQTDMNKVGGAIATWADLNAAMANGGVLQLSQSLTATNLDGALVVPAGKTVVLDLNGFTLDRHLTSAQENGSVIINNGTLAITDNVGGAEIKGGYNSGNGGGIVNNGTFTLYGGKITANYAAQGAGVYNSVANDGNAGFWMTGGLIAENEAASYPAIKGDVTFSNLAVVQINAGGNTVSAATAIAGLATYDYIKPVMPNMDMFAILAELHNALGNDVWAGYGDATGVITYAQGTEPNSFKATFMGGAYAIEIPFGDFTQAVKVDNGDGTYTYNLDVNLPAQTGLSHEVLHVTTNANGEITGIHSDIAQTDMNKLGGAIASWSALNAAMANGGVLQLSQSLTATNLDGALIVPAGKTVVLDLNGFSLDRNLGGAQANGCVIINNGTLAITDNVGGAEIKGGYNSGNGGGIVNNGTFTLYGGKITANHAAQGAGVYNSVANDGTVGFWMTGGLIAGNTANSYPAIKGDVTFSNLAVVQINAGGNTVSAATAIAGLAAYDYIKPVMPNMDMFAILAELHNALGNDVWTGYGVNTGVMSYSQGDEANEFRVSFMGGTYTIDLPFGDFTSATKADNGDGTFTYTLTVNLPAQTGMTQETLHVTTNANGEITAIHSDNAEVDLKKETNGTIATWADLQNALNEGGLIKLTNDIVNGDAPLVIPENTTVVLDLNGHTINRGMTDADENGSVIVNNGTLAIVDHSELANGEITGGKTTGNGGGVLNNGIFTLYGGEITGNAAAIGGGVYNNGGAQGFWMTGGLIDANTANSNPAIGGDVIFNSAAVIQINADGDKVSIEAALAGMATYSYIKPVMPDYDDYTTEVAITANADPDNTGIYYSTFYDSANKYMLPAGVEAYVADLSGSDLVLTKIAGAGQVIPADEAVILRASVQNFSLLPSFEAPVSVSTNNDLEGVDDETLIVSIDGLTNDNCYVLSGTDQYGVGFYKIGSSVTTLKAHKAYVKYVGSQNGAPRRMRFVFNTATGVEAVTGYGLPVTEKRIENGVLYIIKNDVRYNVQGQIVK